MARFLLLILLAFTNVVVMAQQLPLYTQYVFNPYMVNPSMVAASNRAEVNLLYRQQWTAVQNGPQTFQGDIQYPLSSKMGIGLQVVNDKTVLLNATSAMVTYGYRVNLATNHVLGFGLSAGVFANRIDLSDLAPSDLNDPALMSAKNNNMAVDGQFGVHYRFKGFLLGASAVNLFDRKTFSPESFQKTKLTQLKNNIFFASYRFTVLPDRFYIQPNVAYRMSSNNINYYEASAVLSFKNVIDVGGGYRQDFGPTSMVRVNLGQFQAGFAYDFPSPTAQVSTGGTREIQLKWRFGREKSRPVVVSTTETELPPVVEPVKEEEKVAPKEEVKVQEEKVQPEEKKAEPIVQPTPVIEQPVVVEKQPEPPPVEYYMLVAGTYKDRSHAENRLKELKARKIKGEIIPSVDKDGNVVYYVHLPDYKVTDPTVERVKEIQKETSTPDAWFRKIDFP